MVYLYNLDPLQLYPNIDFTFFICVVLIFPIAYTISHSAQSNPFYASVKATENLYNVHNVYKRHHWNQ